VDFAVPKSITLRWVSRSPAPATDCRRHTASMTGPRPDLVARARCIMLTSMQDDGLRVQCRTLIAIDRES
jgi:hypothetical protein